MFADCRHVVVDGHSVIFAHSRLAALHAARPRAARTALIRALQGFQDHAGLSVSVAFDGTAGQGEFRPPDTVEVRYATRHQTADALIERAVASFPRPQDVVVVTGDLRERHTIESLGAVGLSPQGLFDWMRHVLPSDPFEHAEEKTPKTPNSSKKSC